MANIKTLTISIAANISDFTKGLNKARRDLNKWAKDIPGATMGVGTAFAASATAAAAGLTYLTSQAMESIDAVAKLSDRLGISTESLAAYRHAASLSGVSNEELTLGLEKFIKSLPTGSDVGASFEKIAGQIAAIKDPVAQAQAAVEVFGKSGQRLLPLLNADLAAAKAEAEKLGITFSRMEAAKVEAANDAVTRLKTVLEGVGTQLAIAVAPMLAVAADELREFATGGDGLKSKLGDAIEYVALGIAKATDIVGLFEGAWYMLQSGFTQVVRGMLYGVGLVARGLDALLEKMGMTQTGLGAFFKELDSGLGKDADAAALKANRAFDKFQYGENEAKVKSLYYQAKHKIDEASKKIADAAQAKVAGNTKVAGLEDLLGKKGEAGLNLFNGLGKGLDKFVKDFKDKTADAVQALQDKAQAVFDATRTPAERLAIEIKKLQDNPLINGDLLKRGVEKLQNEYLEAIGNKNGPSRTGGIAQLSSLVSLRGGVAGNNQQKVEAPKMERILGSMLETSKSMDNTLKNKAFGVFQA